ncbi:hypothetical protein LARI1_G008171 [Lachnellula arida]|uniref:Uncharacterized protein n=1 Tax=Lachnellula arida TaxID=1316785 RepID=A0A8T9B3Q5_9HELO|nr:hypothetical protein LARI1_G008171 [Lachnellula arida]
MASTESPSTTSTSTPPTRRAYKGSCHCMRKNAIHNLPHPPTPHHLSHRPHHHPLPQMQLLNVPQNGLPPRPAPARTLRFPAPVPAQPFRGPKRLHVFRGAHPLVFLRDVRGAVFCFCGEGEEREVEIEGERKMVWTAKRDRWVSGTSAKGFDYLTVNGVTIEPGQEGFDMREWMEKGWIAYLDVRDGVGEPRFSRPYDGGAY